MAKWASTAVLDGGLDHVSANATRLLLLSAYAAGDSYATVVANALCTVTIDSSDFSKSGASGAARVLTLASQSGTASATSSTPDLHVALTDGTANVLLVTDEVTDQGITNGNTVTFPAVTYTSSQPA